MKISTSICLHLLCTHEQHVHTHAHTQIYNIAEGSFNRYSVSMSSVRALRLDAIFCHLYGIHQLPPDKPTCSIYIVSSNQRIGVSSGCEKSERAIISAVKIFCRNLLHSRAAHKIRRLCRNELNVVVDCRTFTCNRFTAPAIRSDRPLQSDKLRSNHHAISLRLQFFM